LYIKQRYIVCQQKIFIKGKKNGRIMEKIKERLKILIKENGGNQAEIARQIGISPNHLATILSSKTGLSATIIIGLAKAGYDVQWLLTGESNENIIAGMNNRITELESDLKDANNLIDSLERILKGK